MKLPIRLLVRLDHMLIFRLFYTIGIKIHKDLEEVGYHIFSAVDKVLFTLPCQSLDQLYENYHNEV